MYLCAEIPQRRDRESVNHLINSKLNIDMNIKY